MLAGLGVSHFDLRYNLTQRLSRVRISCRILFCVCPQILQLSLLQNLGILHLLVDDSSTYLELVEIVLASAGILDSVLEPGLLEAVPLVGAVLLEHGVLVLAQTHGVHLGSRLLLLVVRLF